VSVSGILLSVFVIIFSFFFLAMSVSACRAAVIVQRGGTGDVKYLQVYKLKNR